MDCSARHRTGKDPGKTRATAADAAFHRAQRHPAHSGDLGVIHAMELMEHNRLTRLRRHFRKGPAHYPAPFPLFNVSQRIGRLLIPESFVFAILQRLIDCVRSTCAAVMIDQQIPPDFQQPALETAGLRPESRK